MTAADRVLVLDHEQTRAVLTPDALLPAVRAALVATGRQEASTPARIAAFSPAGLLGAMPGYVPELGRLRALLNGEAVTAVRTAASATVAFCALAPSVPEQVAVIGAGAQAHAQLDLLAHLDLRAEVVVAVRSPQPAARRPCRSA